MKIQLCLLTVSIYLAFCYASPVGNGQCALPQLSLSANDFGFELTKQIDNKGNLFISPFSIYTALSLLYLGSGGETAEQIQTALQLRSTGFTSSRFHEAFEKLLKGIKASNDEYRLLLANGLFVQKDLSLNAAYVDGAKRFYEAAVKHVDFFSNGEGAKKEINDWVAKNTQNKIPDFLQEPLDPTTVLALLNAIYFKGIWKTQFSPNHTSEGVFYKNDGETKKVMYMSLHKEKFRFFEDPETRYKYLELPYKGEHIVMLLALPTSLEDETDLEMSSDLLCRINRNLAPKKLQSIVLPKFKMDYRTGLKDALIGLGIKEVFTPLANLTGIRKEGDLQVSHAQHAAVIEVNEEGSEAAAVTGVFITRLSLITGPEFVANHPFLLYIIDRRNELVLFSGRVADP